MAVRDSIIIRIKKSFVEEILDKIIEQQKDRGIINCGYPDASEILRLRIIKAGGLKED